MSIPRIAIERPVTMFMVSAVIVLLGLISLVAAAGGPDARRHLPEHQRPRELRAASVRPRWRSWSSGRSSRRWPPCPASSRSIRTASEGSASMQLSFAWGSNLSEAADEVRTRVDRVRGRLPEDADNPTIFKFDSSSQPIMSIGVEGDFDRVTLREIAENDLVPRFERVEGVAAVTVMGGLRRQIHVRAVEGEDHGARLVGRSRGPVDSVREPEHPARRSGRGRHDLSAPQPGPVREPRPAARSRRADQGRRARLPARHRGGEGHHRRPAVVPAHQRQARRPDADHEAVGQEHGRDRARPSARRSSARTAKCRACG